MKNGYRKCFLVVLSASVLQTVTAANVVWKTGVFGDTPGGWEFYEESGRAYPYVMFEKTDDIYGVTIKSRDLFFAAWASGFAVMEEGSVVDLTTLRAAEIFSDSGMITDRVIYDKTFTIPYNGSVYLGFVTEIAKEDWSGYQNGYGWVKFNVVHGSLQSYESAIDLDGGPMIVGGGAFIPEPCGGLLLLVGTAALGLRRKKECIR